MKWRMTSPSQVSYIILTRKVNRLNEKCLIYEVESPEADCLRHAAFYSS